MGIYKLSTDIKKMAMTVPNVAMASFGDISLYDNKPIIAYPYVNIDIINDTINFNTNSKYLFRLYVVDRNEPFVAYNKCEKIIDELMLKLDIPNYTCNFFSLDFQDQVNGLYVDINYDDTINLSCQFYESGAFITEEVLPIDEYIVTEENQKITEENL